MGCAKIQSRWIGSTLDAEWDAECRRDVIDWRYRAAWGDVLDAVSESEFRDSWDLGLLGSADQHVRFGHGVYFTLHDREL